jgi:two-component system nitrate/nitrite response regulator NarL
LNAIREGQDLSPRETDVALLIAQCQSNKEIAKSLRLDVNTIKNHVSAILTKKGYKSRVQIALQYYTYINISAGI